MRIFHFLNDWASGFKEIFMGLRVFSFIFLAAFLASCSNGAIEEKFLLRDRPEVLRPFVWLGGPAEVNANFQKDLDYGDPLRVTTLLLDEWIRNRDEKTIAPLVDKVVDKWRLLEPEGGLYYTFPYEGLAPGWWSGMDSWAFPMLLIGLWQETGRQDYKRIADKLIQRAARNVGDGGTVWRDSKGCWFSEYSWKNMKAEDEYNVLNGHLYALQAVKMIAQALHDERLNDLYKCGLEGTKARSAQFLLEDKWALYMLRPATINPTHYLIYETMQFDALAYLDDDPFFKEQAAIRRRLLTRHFPINVRKIDGEQYLSFSMISAPHPYVIDTYPIRIDCSDGVGRQVFERLNPREEGASIASRVMINDRFDLEVSKTNCRLESLYGGKSFTLFNSSVKEIEGESIPGHEKSISVEALFDAAGGEDGAFTIDPSRRVSSKDSPETYLDTQGRLVIALSESSVLSDRDLIGVELAADGPLAIGITIVSGGKDFFRYYPAVRKGDKELILISPLGFDGGEAIQSVEKLIIFIYTDKQNQTVSGRINKVVLFRNSGELYDYFKKFDPSFYTE